MVQPNQTIALLGQPNVGKSTLFNKLTGLHQHVGNWPGKTVEKKSGTFSQDDARFNVLDLPGTYSLSPQSMEEGITRDFILSGKADAVILVLDASQFERSLYLLAEFTGIRIPAVIALNMTDAAEQKGIQIDSRALSKTLGVEVIPLVAVKGTGIDGLIRAVHTAITRQALIKESSLYSRYEKDGRFDFSVMKEIVGSASAIPDPCGAGWAAVKYLANDPLIKDAVREHLQKSKRENNDPADSGGHGDSLIMHLADVKSQWIQALTRFCVEKPAANRSLPGFDRVALHPLWGKITAVGFIAFGLVLSLLLVSPLFLLTARVPDLCRTAEAFLNRLGTWDLLVSLTVSALIPGLSMALVLVLCVAGFVFVIALMEDVGYLARIAFVFNNSMGRFGLHGKSVMPLIMGLTCNIAGVTAARVIDSWKQRSLTVIVSLVVPCLAVWSVISLVSGIFFGSLAVIVVLALFAACLVHIFVTARVFRKILNIDRDSPGLIMELPPYHPPNFRTILTRVFRTGRSILKKSMGIIVCVAVIIWALSLSPDNRFESSLFYTLGQWVEPAARFFGMDWRLFIAFIISGMGKEAALGVLAMLFGLGNGTGDLTGVMTGASVAAFTPEELTTVMSGVAGITPAMALAFIFAYFLNIPCIAALTVVYTETRSAGLTVLTTVYYLATALTAGFLVYHTARLLI